MSKKFAKLLHIPFLNSKVTSQADIHVFTTEKNVVYRTKIKNLSSHLQTGDTFGERLQHAVTKLVVQGYDQIIIVGSDCPELQSTDITTAFQKLSNHQLVLGPDHRGGCYLIGFHAEASLKIWGIQWQANTDCAELLEVFGSDQTYLLPMKHDIDSIADVRLLSHCKNFWGIKAKELLQENKKSHKTESSQLLIQLSTDTQRPRWQLPPPHQS
ncbi:MAG TPA: DUF2064 domain-containing protein [Acidobacteriota bacterium]